MATFNHASKELVEADLLSGVFADSCIMNSDLDELNSKNTNWSKIDMNDTNCNDAVFNSTKFNECNFYRSSLIRSNFYNCNLLNTNFSGLSLIKVNLQNSRLNAQIFDSCTMQRAQINHCIVQNSRLKDFEGVYAQINNTVFKSCFFEINYACGMNGFSTANLENCIFINCDFAGNPLRGANVTNCTFVGCTGEITDDINAEVTCGLPHLISEKKEILHREKAMQLINGVTNA